jgi:hypothetical protein
LSVFGTYEIYSAADSSAYRVLDAVLLKRIPDARSALNGDRRKGKGLPPEGMPERRK